MSFHALFKIYCDLLFWFFFFTEAQNRNIQAPFKVVGIRRRTKHHGKVTD